MALNKLKKHVKNFEKKAGFDRTSAIFLMKMLEKEVGTLRKHSMDKKVADHQIMDIQVLLLQLANRYDTNMDAEWKKHWVKSKKYVKQKYGTPV